MSGEITSSARGHVGTITVLRGDGFAEVEFCSSAWGDRNLPVPVDALDRLIALRGDVTVKITIEPVKLAAPVVVEAACPACGRPERSL